MNNIEMGHPAHFIGADNCRFKRATYLDNGYIVSSVGEWIINGEIKEIGFDRHYETMVFNSDNTQQSCGCYGISDLDHIDMEPANTAIDCLKNHEALVTKWSEE